VPAATNPAIAGIRIVLAGGLLLTLALATAGPSVRRLVGGRAHWPRLALAAAAMITYQTAFFSAAARTGVAIGTVTTIGSAPAFTGLLRLALGQAGPTRRWLLATGGAVAGCAALVGGGHGTGAEPVGIALALLSGAAYAVYVTVVSALLDRGEDSRTVTAVVFGLAAVVMLPVLLAAPTGWLLTGRGVVVAGYLGGVATAGAYVLFARGLRTTSATTATTLTLAEPAVAAVLGVVLLGERLGPTALAGLALLAASLAVAAIPDRSARSAGSTTIATQLQ
jgi:DME family drug/metabolite transporter